MERDKGNETTNSGAIEPGSRRSQASDSHVHEKLSRVQDHVADNREDILKIEVNIAHMQDELEAMSWTLDAFVGVQKIKDENAENSSQDESPEQRDLYE